MRWNRAGAKPVFQIEQLVTEGRLGEMQHAACAGEAPVLGDGADQAEVADLEDHDRSMNEVHGNYVNKSVD
jgi:hypothetical protein